jgi:hypothetical protein
VHQPPLGRHQARRCGPAAATGAGRRRAGTRGRVAGCTRGAFMLLTLRRVMAGETIRLFKCYLDDVADGERAAAMLWRWRHASESGVCTIGTGAGRSFRDLMLALGAACGRAPVIAYADMPEAMRPNAHINMSPRRRAAGCARSAITPRLCRSRMPCATSSPITCRSRTRSYKRRWAAGRHQTHACCDRRR